MSLAPSFNASSLVPDLRLLGWLAEEASRRSQPVIHGSAQADASPATCSDCSAKPVFPLFAPCDCRGHLQPGYARAERHLRHPDVGPVQGRNRLGLRFLRRFRLARTVEGDRLANERLEGGLVNSFSFVDVDRAAYVSVETRVEETGRILQRRALGEGKLHDTLVGFAGADDAVVRPNRSAHPLPLLDGVRVRFLDELAHSAECFPAPVHEFGDSFRDEFRCRLALARARLFHVLIPVFSGSDHVMYVWRLLARLRRR